MLPVRLGFELATYGIKAVVATTDLYGLNRFFFFIDFSVIVFL